MNKRVNKWTSDDKFAFATQRLRATTIPNKKAASNKKACRKWQAD